MPRVILVANDHGHTRYTLDLDPELVRVKDRHTLTLVRPDWWEDDGEEDRLDIDDLTLMRAWYDHDDEGLADLGITIVEITEKGKRLERGEPWEAGVIPFPEDHDFSSTLPLTQTWADGTVRKVMVRVPDFRQVRPWGLIVSPPFGEDGDEEEKILSAAQIIEAARNGDFGLRLLGEIPIHLLN